VLTQVEALLQRGKRVRALVRDEARGRQLLVCKVEAIGYRCNDCVDLHDCAAHPCTETFTSRLCACAA